MKAHEFILLKITNNIAAGSMILNINTIEHIIPGTSCEARIILRDAQNTEISVIEPTFVELTKLLTGKTVFRRRRT